MLPSVSPLPDHLQPGMIVFETLLFHISNTMMQTLPEYWHFVIIFLILLLVVAWVQHLMTNSRNRRKQKQAGEKSEEQTSMPVMVFITFLTLIVAFSPYMIPDFFGTEDMEQRIPDPANFNEVTLTVYGMDDGANETFIIKQLGGLPGVESVIPSHEEQEVVVVYDRNMVNLGKIVQVLEDAGYTVTIR